MPLSHTADVAIRLQLIDNRDREHLCTFPCYKIVFSGRSAHSMKQPRHAAVIDEPFSHSFGPPGFCTTAYDKHDPVESQQLCGINMKLGYNFL